MRHRKPVDVGCILRLGSTTERALALALAAVGELGASAEMLSVPPIALPAYAPAESARGPEAKALVAALRRDDGVIFSSPSYHGSVSGLLKKAIDYVEDMRRVALVYLADRAVGIIVCADGKMRIGDGGAQVDRERTAASSAELAEHMTQMEMTFRLMG